MSMNPPCPGTIAFVFMKQNGETTDAALRALPAFGNHRQICCLPGWTRIHSTAAYSKRRKCVERSISEATEAYAFSCLCTCGAFLLQTHLLLSHKRAAHLLDCLRKALNFDGPLALNVAAAQAFLNSGRFDSAHVRLARSRADHGKSTRGFLNTQTHGLCVPCATTLPATCVSIARLLAGRTHKRAAEMRQLSRCNATRHSTPHISAKHAKLLQSTVQRSTPPSVAARSTDRHCRTATRSASARTSTLLSHHYTRQKLERCSQCTVLT